MLRSLSDSDFNAHFEASISYMRNYYSIWIKENKTRWNSYQRIRNRKQRLSSVLKEHGYSDFAIKITFEENEVRYYLFCKILKNDSDPEQIAKDLRKKFTVKSTNKYLIIKSDT